MNVSVRPKGREQFGTKVEVKNMNSFSAMQKAIDFEVNRQASLLRDGCGDEIVQESRFFDEGKQVRTNFEFNDITSASASSIAEISGRSPRKIFIFIM